MEEKGPWRGSRHDNLLSFPSSRVSGDRRGFEIFSRRVGPGTWYPYHPPVLVVLELALHQKLKKQWNQGQGVLTRIVMFKLSVAIRLTLECLYTPFDKIRQYSMTRQTDCCSTVDM